MNDHLGSWCNPLDSSLGFISSVRTDDAAAPSVQGNLVTDGGDNLVTDTGDNLVWAN